MFDRETRVVEVMDVHIRATDVTKRFRRRRVLEGFDVDVRGGEAVALVGENGQGKTTALKILAGLLPHDDGRVERSGDLGYCPQTPGVIEHLDVDDHLALFGSAAGLPRTAARDRGRRQLAALGLDPEENDLAKNLSGGTRQKLNLALALLGDPDVLLLDEPYQGFDFGSYLDFWGHVDEWKDAGKAVVVVTHLLTDTSRVDRVIELRHGRAHDSTHGR